MEEPNSTLPKKNLQKEKNRKLNLSEGKIQTYLLYPILRARRPSGIYLGMSDHL